MQRHPSSSILRPRAAFTLIELLVVVAVISVLAAMLLPALRSAKERGQLTKCANNLRQLGLAAQLYADDYEGLLPTYHTNGMDPAYGSWPWWGDFIGPYVGLKGYPDSRISQSGRFLSPPVGQKGAGTVFACPSWQRNQGGNNNNPYTSYHLENLVGWPRRILVVGGTNYSGFAVARDLKDPARTVFIHEAAAWGYAHCIPFRRFDTTTTFDGAGSPTTYTDPYSCGGIWRHLGFANVVFVDGHVESTARYGSATEPNGLTQYRGIKRWWFKQSDEAAYP